MAAPKDAHAMTSHFKKLWKAKYGVDPTINRNVARWSFDSMLMDMSPVEVKALIEYYFETISPNRHSLEWFLYNYEKLITSKQANDRDKDSLVDIREATRRRVEEWEKRNG